MSTIIDSLVYKITGDMTSLDSSIKESDKKIEDLKRKAEAQVIGLKVSVEDIDKALNNTPHFLKPQLDIRGLKTQLDDLLKLPPIKITLDMSEPQRQLQSLQTQVIKISGGNLQQGNPQQQQAGLTTSGALAADILGTLITANILGNRLGNQQIGISSSSSSSPSSNISNTYHITKTYSRAESKQTSSDVGISIDPYLEEIERKKKAAKDAINEKDKDKGFGHAGSAVGSSSSSVLKDKLSGLGSSIDEGLSDVEAAFTGSRAAQAKQTSSDVGISIDPYLEEIERKKKAAEDAINKKDKDKDKDKGFGHAGSAPVKSGIVMAEVALGAGIGYLTAGPFGAVVGATFAGLMGSKKFSPFTTIPGIIDGLKDIRKNQEGGTTHFEGEKNWLLRKMVAQSDAEKSKDIWDWENYSEDSLLKKVAGGAVNLLNTGMGYGPSISGRPKSKLGSYVSQNIHKVDNEVYEVLSSKKPMPTPKRVSSEDASAENKWKDFISSMEESDSADVSKHPANYSGKPDKESAARVASSASGGRVAHVIVDNYKQFDFGVGGRGSGGGGGGSGEGEDEGGSDGTGGSKGKGWNNLIRKTLRHFGITPTMGIGGGIATIAYETDKILGNMERGRLANAMGENAGMSAYYHRQIEQPTGIGNTLAKAYNELPGTQIWQSIVESMGGDTVRSKIRKAEESISDYDFAVARRAEITQNSGANRALIGATYSLFKDPAHQAEANRQKFKQQTSEHELLVAEKIDAANSRALSKFAAEGLDPNASSARGDEIRKEKQDRIDQLNRIEANRQHNQDVLEKQENKLYSTQYNWTSASMKIALTDSLGAAISAAESQYVNNPEQKALAERNIIKQFKRGTADIYGEAEIQGLRNQGLGEKADIAGVLLKQKQQLREVQGDDLLSTNRRAAIQKETNEEIKKITDDFNENLRRMSASAAIAKDGLSEFGGAMKSAKDRINEEFTQSTYKKSPEEIERATRIRDIQMKALENEDQFNQTRSRLGIAGMGAGNDAMRLRLQGNQRAADLLEVKERGEQRLGEIEAKHAHHEYRSELEYRQTKAQVQEQNRLEEYMVRKIAANQQAQAVGSFMSLFSFDPGIPIPEKAHKFTQKELDHNRAMMNRIGDSTTRHNDKFLDSTTRQDLFHYKSKHDYGDSTTRHDDSKKDAFSGADILSVLQQIATNTGKNIVMTAVN